MHTQKINILYQYVMFRGSHTKNIPSVAKFVILLQFLTKFNVSSNDQFLTPELKK